MRFAGYVSSVYVTNVRNVINRLIKIPHISSETGYELKNTFKQF